ncbi:hypothetical protein Mapa_000694 [Marchantia paleacea]|nr:hypothetical protein Mapa_000694 [Marchantia paleacea]
MESSSSKTFAVDESRPAFKKVNDELYEMYKPDTGSGQIDIDIVFFHGIQAGKREELFWQSWVQADSSTCWLNTWLADEIPYSRIMSVSYDSSLLVTESEGRMDMYVIAENLAYSLMSLGAVGQSRPVVLVGHGVGGLVLKAVCLTADRMGANGKKSGLNSKAFKTFLGNMKGAFFYSTASLGSRTSETITEHRGPLLQFQKLLSKEAARLNSEFSSLRQNHGWKTYGVIGAIDTPDCSRRSSQRRTSWDSFLSDRTHASSSTLVVEEGSARNDVDGFCVLSGEDSDSICNPRGRQSNNLLLLVKFLQEILDEEEEKRYCSLLHLLNFPKELVRMPKRVEMVVKMLQLEEAEPSRLSLVGTGGIGKSTLAKEVLWDVKHQFDFCCYVEDVKGKLTREDLHDLVANNLYSGTGQKVSLQSTSLQLLKGKKVLMVLDDVDSEKQISYFLRTNWWGRGSRLIVTSRLQGGFPTFTMCDVPFLNMEEAKQLFVAQLMTDVREEIPEDMVEEVVAKCDGLPLTLEVIGSYLCAQKRLDVWSSALAKLGRVESLDGSKEDKLWLKLRVSVDALAPIERSMFLHLAVFDKWGPQQQKYDLPWWEAAWDSLYETSAVSSLHNLVSRSLIRIVKESTTRAQVIPPQIWIHEQLRDMGKSICRPHDEEIEKCRGAWQPEDANHLLAQYKGTDAQTEMLSVAEEQHPTVITNATALQRQYDWSSVGRLRMLKFLRMSNVGLSETENSGKRFPPNLAFLHMSSCCQPKLPNRLGGSFWSKHSDYDTNLQGLQQVAYLKADNSWPLRAEDVEGIQKLSVLILENCTPLELPSNFYKLSNLRILIIRDRHLKKLPEDFGRLPALKILCLETVNLAKLPNSIWCLTSLQTLFVGCSSLKTWPSLIPRPITLGGNTFSPLSNVKSLTLENLLELPELPDAFGLMRSLEDIKILTLTTLRTLPEVFDKFSRLRHLEIKGCESLESLSTSFGEIPSLTSLELCDLTHLQRLPESLGHLKALSDLYIHNVGIVSLPESTGELRKLETIRLYNVESLRCLPETIGKLKSLKALSIFCSPDLLSLPDCIGQIDSLESIFITACDRLRSLPESIVQLNNLKKLVLSNCASLQSLPNDVGLATSLRVISINRCPKFRTLPESVRQISTLETLTINICENFELPFETIGQVEHCS